MRLLILAAVVYFLYRALKTWMLGAGQRPEIVPGQSADRIDDVMIQDPYCGIYFPRNSGVKARLDGRDISFCSADCRDKYLSEHDATSG